MNRFFVWTFFISFFSSCAFHSGNVSTGSPIDCPFKDIVTGESETFRLLGIGGLDREALILEAKQDMYSRYRTSKNIKFSNFCVDFKTTIIFIYSSTKATVSAELYDCESPGEENNPARAVPLIDGFASGDSVMYGDNMLMYGNNMDVFYPGKILNHTIGKAWFVSIKSYDGKFKTQKINSDYLYKTSKHPENKYYFGYDLGEVAYVDVLIRKSNTKVVKPCTIIGLNKNKLLIRYTTDEGNQRIVSVKKSQIKQ